MQEAEKGVALYTEKQIQIAAFLGGPVPIGILFYQNFKKLGRERDAYLSLAFAFIFLGLLIFASLAEDSMIMKLPRLALPVFYSIVTTLIYRITLFKQVQEAMHEDARTASNWSVAGLTLLGLVLTLAMTLGLAFTTPLGDNFAGDHVNYENNRLYYEGSIGQDQLDEVAQSLYSLDYFDAQGYDARVIETAEAFEITVFYLESSWTDEQFLDYFRDQSLLLEGSLNKKTIFVLADYNFRGHLVTKRIGYD